MSAELTVAGPQAVAVQGGQISPADLMAGIHRLASDPGTDVAKMESLIKLFQEQQDRQAKQAFNSAMVACQAEMPRITKDKKIVHEAKPGKTGMSVRYASYENIDRQVRPIYQAHGFSVQFSTATPEAGNYLTTATVRHSGGHAETYSMPLKLDQSGGKNDIQGMGSNMAYARRYLLTMIFNIVTEGDDNDGAGKPKLITAKQAEQLRTRLDACGADKNKFCQVFGGIMTLEELPVSRLAEAEEMIAKKEASRK